MIEDISIKKIIGGTTVEYDGNYLFFEDDNGVISFNKEEAKELINLLKNIEEAYQKLTT